MVFRNSAIALTVMLLASSSAQSMIYVRALPRPSVPSYACMKCQAWDLGKLALKMKLIYVAYKLGARAINYGTSKVPHCVSTKVAKWTPSCVSKLGNWFGKTCLGTGKVAAVNGAQTKVESEVIAQSTTIAAMQRELQAMKDVLAKRGSRVENTSDSASRATELYDASKQ